MKKSSIKDTIEEINQLKKLLKESYVFDEEEIGMDEEPIEEKSMVVDSSEKINKIRAIALEGIQDYAEDVDSEEYDFFKKIWLMCDKVCSEKGKDENHEME